MGAYTSEREVLLLTHMRGIQEKLESLDWTLIVDLTEWTQGVNTRFKVSKKGKTRIVTQKTSGRKFEIAKCTIGDHTAIIDLTLWNDDIDAIEEGKTYTLLNGSITVYDECMSLTRGRRGELIESLVQVEDLNEQVDMSRPFMGRPKRKSKTRSSTGRTLDGEADRQIRKFSGRKSF